MSTDKAELSVSQHKIAYSEFFKNKMPFNLLVCCNLQVEVTIGLIDCGVHSGVQDFQGANLTVKNFTSSIVTDDNLLSHGTYSVGLLIAQGNNLLSGLVPNTKLLMAQVIGQYGYAEENSIYRALKWFQSEQVDVIAIPFGAFQTNVDIDQLLSDISANNVLIFAATGNQYPSPTLFPANHPDVIAVGACDRYGKILPDCCRSPEPDLLLPSDNMPGLVNGDVIAGRSGTSVACVLAAGMAAAHLLDWKRESSNIFDRQRIINALQGVRLAA